MKFIYLFTFVALLVSCKNDAQSNNPNLSSDKIAVEMKPGADPAKLAIPESCAMINTENLQRILNISKYPITVKNSGDPADKSNKSCFFKWDDPSTANAGIFLQISTNPAHAEFPQYISNFVAAKITDGETDMNTNQPSKFKKFVVNGMEGAFSFQLGKAYWNINNDYLFMLAFNISTLSEAKMLDATKEILEEVNSNFPKN